MNMQLSENKNPCTNICLTKRERKNIETTKLQIEGYFVKLSDF